MFAATSMINFSLVSLSLMFTGLMAGFFFAWSCSTMQGLDRTNAKTAIIAMNAVNRFVRTSLFILPFLATPILLIVNGVIQFSGSQKSGALFFFIAAFFYLIGVSVVTIVVSEPLNYRLAETSLTETEKTTQLIWTAYSTKWQFWNLIRTISSLLSFMITFVAALVSLK